MTYIIQVAIVSSLYQHSPSANREVILRQFLSSEVIESVFGKQKRLEGDQASNGLTGLLLALGVIVSTLNATLIKEALTQVSTQMVWDWCHQHLGRSVQAKRKKAFDPPEEAKTEEQNKDQLCVE